MVTKPMQEGQVNRQVTIYHSSGAVSTAQEEDVKVKVNLN